LARVRSLVSRCGLLAAGNQHRPGWLARRPACDRRCRPARTREAQDHSFERDVGSACSSPLRGRWLAGLFAHDHAVRDALRIRIRPYCRCQNGSEDGDYPHRGLGHLLAPEKKGYSYSFRRPGTKIGSQARQIISCGDPSDWTGPGRCRAAPCAAVVDRKCEARCSHARAAG